MFINAGKDTVKIKVWIQKLVSCVPMVPVLSFCALVSPNYPIYCTPAAWMSHCLHIFAPISSVHVHVTTTWCNEDSEYAQTAINNQHVLTTKSQLTEQWSGWRGTKVFVWLVAALWEARVDCFQVLAHVRCTRYTSLAQEGDAHWNWVRKYVNIAT